MGTQNLSAFALQASSGALCLILMEGEVPVLVEFTSYKHTTFEEIKEYVAKDYPNAVMHDAPVVYSADDAYGERHTVMLPDYTCVVVIVRDGVPRGIEDHPSETGERT